MSGATIIYWRAIPTQVVVGSGRKAIKRELAPRFMVAVDKAAMKSGAESTDAYLEEWRRAPAEAPEGDAEAAADEMVRDIEAAYPAKRLAKIADNGGFEPGE